MKIYIDGFHIDDVELEEIALTPKVKAALEEEGKVVKKIVPVPKHNPQFILIETEL